MWYVAPESISQLLVSWDFEATLLIWGKERTIDSKIQYREKTDLYTYEY